MIKKTIFTIILLGSILMHAQLKKVNGNTFDIDGIHEKEFKLALTDDYNQYVTSYINTDGLMANAYPHKKILVRKLDQKGNYLETYVKDYANKTNGTLHNYLGSHEIGTDKIIFFTEEYSGKTKKKEIFQHIFNKKDGSFATSSIAGFAIESANKSGTTKLLFSENGKYAAIFNDRFANKKIPNINDIIVINLRDLSTLWKKEVQLSDDFVEEDASLTDSGRILLIRKPSSGWKLGSKLELVSDKEQKDLPVENKYYLKKAFTFTIDDKDYAAVIGKFGFTASVTGEVWGDIFLYDLTKGSYTSGKIDKMASNISDFKMIEAFSSNGSATVFGQVITQYTPPETAYNRFPDPVNSYGAAYIFTFSEDGKISSNFLDNENKSKINVFKHNNSFYVSGTFESRKTTFRKYYEPIKILDEKNYTPGYIQLSNENPLEDHPAPDGDLIKFLPETNRLIFLYRTEKSMNMISYYNILP
ncbi:hypothetical protein ACI513_06375 [Chryseobacterium sp. M5]|uniref:hypothetical protein n=1 Tax=Chryseobacterium sp. M5 TaxID=3379128 RepID=UPI0038576992